jgi:hypothetical protein
MSVKSREPHSPDADEECPGAPGLRPGGSPPPARPPLAGGNHRSDRSRACQTGRPGTSNKYIELMRDFVQLDPRPGQNGKLLTSQDATKLAGPRQLSGWAWVEDQSVWLTASRRCVYEDEAIVQSWSRRASRGYLCRSLILRQPGRLEAPVMPSTGPPNDEQ